VLQSVSTTSFASHFNGEQLTNLLKLSKNFMKISAKPFGNTETSE